MQIATTLAEFSVSPDGTVKVFVSLAVILTVALAIAVTAAVAKKARSERSKNDVGPISKELQDVLNDDVLDYRVNPTPKQYKRRCNRNE